VDCSKRSTRSRSGCSAAPTAEDNKLLSADDGDEAGGTALPASAETERTEEVGGGTALPASAETERAEEVLLVLVLCLYWLVDGRLLRLDVVAFGMLHRTRMTKIEGIYLNILLFLILRFVLFPS